ncbi:putative GTP-binding protein 6 [Cephus cinctus]|uniref:GTP-binding protein 6 n=1 Tax=Cephus cinctus TaxID=211228 RepID=A0AAJ7C1B9_CEPCN|nr:putative GTP-binding protein 6 [Cephus cinctus]
MQFVRKLACLITKRTSNYCKLRITCRSNTYIPQIIISRFRHELPDLEDDEQENEMYDTMSAQYLGKAIAGHRVFVVQPYIKWGRDKKRNTTPELQLAEAEALIRTLPNWSVVERSFAPLLSLQKKRLLGSGSLETLKTKVRSNNYVTAVFISTNVLKQVQLIELQNALGVPVYDRYGIVIQIFRAHAKSREAKLQVALAEIPYFWSKINTIADQRGGQINLIESRRKLLQAREVKLKTALKKLKGHRELLRSSRQKSSIPSVAVVGYTNAGKTSLIKALTGDDSLEPKNYLFATLDTTAHEGILPCRLKVLYMDTIGFIQDVPEALIEPFVATLEDAMIADVIVHVHDVSHPDSRAQFDHVHRTIKNLIDDERPIIDVANKCDLAKPDGIPNEVLPVSAVNFTGIDLLRLRIQKKLLAATGRLSIRIRVESGSRAAAWLYKETAVTNAEPDPKNLQYLYLDVIATETQLYKFRHFLKQ